MADFGIFDLMLLKNLSVSGFNNGLGIENRNIFLKNINYLISNLKIRHLRSVVRSYKFIESLRFSFSFSESIP